MRVSPPLGLGSEAPNFIRGLAELQHEAAHTRKLPPVDVWNPPYCGEIDMRIAANGTWYYLGTPILRPALVRLFSTILRREEDGRYVLVTPAEKCGIEVEDLPFRAVKLDVSKVGEALSLSFLTDVGDTVEAGPTHPIRVELCPSTKEPRPSVHVRGRLEARISRSVFYELVDMAEERRAEGRVEYFVHSNGTYFSLGIIEE